LCQQLPTSNWLAKRLVFLLRKPVLKRKQTPIDATVNGVNFRLEPKSNLSDKRLLCTPSLLDGRERAYFEQHMAQQGVLLDIGANIGGYGLLLAAARPDIRVLAVEADPLMADRLRRHVRFSQLDNRCEVIEAAATPESCKVDLFVDSVNRGRNSLLAHEQRQDQCAGSIQVDGMTLLAIMDQYQVDAAALLKMDIEGYEFPVLQAFFQQAEKSRWPHYIQLEQHRKEALNDAVNIAIKQGYQPVFRTRMNVILQKPD
jgi:FkbM family methyltransferase